MSLTQCASCGGFVPRDRCPNCFAVRRRRSLATRLGLLAGPLGGGAIAMTLMACYGMPPCDDGSQGCYEPDASAQGDAAHLPDVRVNDAGFDAPDDVAVDAPKDAHTDAAADAPNDAALGADTGD
jgi:hypothetical protein